MHPDLFHTPHYTLQRVEHWFVLLRDGCPVAQGSMDTVRLNKGYKYCKGVE